MTFGERLAAAMAKHGPLCVGIDPHPGLLEAWGLPQDVDGLTRFVEACVQAFAGHVAVVKPQSAFFERFGAAGIAVLERTLADLREADTLSLLDVKRGDIGTTMEAYAHAYLTDDAPLRADAVTVSPYLGYGSLRPALDLARATGRGVFVLALTSNPDGPSVQHARTATDSVAGAVVAGAAADNADAPGLGHVGLVVGATVGTAVSELGVDLAASRAPLLAPGLGAQGATAADLRTVFGAAAPQVLASASRSVLAAGPDARALRRAARHTAEELARELGRGVDVPVPR
ncbi:MAG TPA: orotidine-5'-phosphate decarboxylase [Segeticoccus sp.]|uniref:orotidine-5'-phosphate decarboxylase n=1 Tax=Segeticoccus sp. TaxID=2706531 RepID=UPI002D7F0602|nr:orotidine-5'-phosphate decarboxylase [Segeticoccus sp.]HET8600629.1 orotidine-5'-phosphate decarboxylase [Segeticoccus sp.]